MHAEARTSLRLMHFNGQGVVEDPVEAARLLRVTAMQGSDDANLGPGYLHDKGWGVAQDDVLAVI
ncbi:MAG: hypothetical protein OXF88_12135 [Rhodobacteraceae bacterium]|nr:hypothetical protein [Paracoccaceae bacterium]